MTTTFTDRLSSRLRAALFVPQTDADQYAKKHKPHADQQAFRWITIGGEGGEGGGGSHVQIKSSTGEIVSGASGLVGKKVGELGHNDAKAHKEPAPARQPKATAKAEAFRPSEHVKISADDITQLRKQDVERVLEWAPEEHRQQMADFITKNRPELLEEVSDVMEELGPSDHSGAANKKDARPSTYLKGDRVEYTGKMVDGFHEVEFMEGTQQGKMGVTRIGPDGDDPDAGKKAAEWKKQQSEFRRLRMERVTADAHPGNGSIVEDKDGKEWMVVKARHGFVECAPIENGKPVVNAGSIKQFVVKEGREDGGPPDLLFKTGRIAYEENKTTSPPMAPWNPTEAMADKRSEFKRGMLEAESNSTEGHRERWDQWHDSPEMSAVHSGLSASDPEYQHFEKQLDEAAQASSYDGDDADPALRPYMDKLGLLADKAAEKQGLQPPGKTELAREAAMKTSGTLEPFQKGDASPHIGRKWQSKEGERHVIGETNTPGGRRLLVQTDGQGLAELLHPEDIDRVASRETLNYEMSRKAAEAKFTEETKEQARKTQPESVTTFTSGMTPLAKKRAEGALSQFTRHNGKEMKRREMIDAAIEKGATVETRPDGKRRLNFPGGSYLDESQVTKIGMDYAAHKAGESQGTDADRVPETTPAPTAKAKKAKGSAETPHMDRLAEHQEKIRSGEATADQVRQWFDETHTPETMAGIKAELSKKTVAELKDMGAGGYYGKQTKGDLVDSMMSRVSGQYHVGGSLTIGMSGEGTFAERQHKARREAVHKQTDADIQKFAGEVKESTERRKAEIEKVVKAIKDPQTLEDFKTRERFAKDKTLTPEMQARYDELSGTTRRAQEAEASATVKGVTGVTGLTAEIKEGFHAKKQKPTYAAVISQRVEKDKYNELNAAAKKLGGYYSSFRGSGAIPGFQFDTREAAEKFKEIAEGKSVDRSDILAERGEVKAANQSETLRGRADAIKGAAEDVLNADRKTNTARRADQAASVTGEARRKLAQSETMHKIADGLESGDLKHLTGVKAGTHIEQLDTLFKRAQYNAIREQEKTDDGKKWNYDKRQSEHSREPSLEDITHAEYPHPRIWSNELLDVGQKLADVPGLKNAAKVLEGIGKATISAKFATQGNGFKFSGGSRVDPAEHEGLARIAKAGKHIRVHQSYDTRLTRQNGGMPVHTADNGRSWGTTPITAVAGAASRGHDLDVIDAPQHQSVPLTGEKEIDALAQVAAKLKNHPNRDLRRLGESAAGEMEKYNRMQQMGIKSLPELRAALREYHGLRATKKAEDPVKVAERKLVGRKIDGFFPTPRSVVERMLDAADIRPGMSVLEPSAGKGDILDAVRDRHGDSVKTTAIEPHSDLRDILAIKGHDVGDRDFLEHSGTHDRIVMNPPFENGQDIAHVRHAYDRLAPGGKLVAIMSAGGGKKREEFDNWLSENGGDTEDLPQGSFSGADAFRQTGVNTRMVTLEKPNQPTKYGMEEQFADSLRYSLTGAIERYRRSGQPDRYEGQRGLFDEAKHPRGQGGLFAEKGGGASPPASAAGHSPATHKAVATRFGIPEAAVKSVLETPLAELQRRDRYTPKNNTSEPTTDFEKHPLGTARIAHWHSDPQEAYVDFLHSFDPKELTPTEHEENVRTHDPSFKKYVEWAKQGIEPPPIDVAQSERTGNYLASNRRRTLAAQDAGSKELKGWLGVNNKETGNPLKYGDIIRAAKEHQSMQSASQKPKVGVAGQQMGLFGGGQVGGQKSLFNVAAPPAKKKTLTHPVAIKISGRLGEILNKKDTISPADMAIPIAPKSLPGQATLFAREGIVIRYDRAEGDDHWITIGAQNHHGGTPVKVNKGGKILVGPGSLRGKAISDLKTHDIVKTTHDGNIAFGQFSLRNTTKLDKPKARAERLERREKVVNKSRLFDPQVAEPLKEKRLPGAVEDLPGVSQNAEGRWTGATQMHYSQMHTDPGRFQYKASGIGADGVTDELKGVTQFNPMLGGQVLAWHDPADGKTYIVNGHHRHELATRSGEHAGWDGKLSVYFVDAKDAKEARAHGAFTNIAEGRGTATDAAKFMRDTGATVEDMKAKGVSLKGAVAANGTTLSGLSDKLFGRLTQERITEPRAVAIAKHLKDHGKQDELLSVIEKQESKTGKAIPDAHISEMAREMEQVPTKRDGGGGLFGDFFERSLMPERAELKAAIRRHFGGEENALKAVSTGRRQDIIESSGTNTIDAEGNKARAKQAASHLENFDRRANAKGDTIAKAVNDHAERLSNAKGERQRKAVASDLTSLIRRLLELGETDAGAEGQNPG